jgi:hypothetical protein
MFLVASKIIGCFDREFLVLCSHGCKIVTLRYVYMRGTSHVYDCTNMLYRFLTIND